MKKNHSIIVVLFVVVGIQSCSLFSKPYKLPPNLTEERKELLISNFYSGRVLYKTHCDSCHGIYSNGSKSAVNFTYIQIERYKSRSVLPDPGLHPFATQLTPIQLELVIDFLTMRKVKDPELLQHKD